MSNAAFHFGILATILAAAFSTTCIRSITCHCGSSSQNYTFCLDDTLNETITCETWSQCQTCKTNGTHCIPCHPKPSGSNCIEVNKELIRRKRQSGSCPDPGTIQNGYRHLTNAARSRSRTFSHGQSFRFYCNEGYRLQGNNKLTCLTSGTWSSSLPKCLEKTPTVYCSAPGQISHGSFRNSALNPAATNRYAVGESVMYHCQYGYELDGNREIACLPSGTWPNMPVCRKTTIAPRSRRPTVTTGNCPDPGSIENGYRRLTSGIPSPSRTFNDGQSFRYFCNEGYQLQGTNVLTCMTSGTWSGSLPWCSKRGNTRGNTPDDRRMVCPSPTIDPNGDMENISPTDPRRRRGGFRTESRVSFTCRNGYILYGTNPIVCLNNGQWATEPPTCQKISSSNIGMCANPGPLRHGGVNVYNYNHNVNRLSSRDGTSNLEYPVGTRLSYECSDGYRLDGEKNLNCVSTGRWSGEKPTCVEDCGLSSLRARGKITGGTNTTAGQFPWMVFLHMDPTNHRCGGVLLDRRTVLSAAHCFDNAIRCTLFIGKLNASNAEDDKLVQSRRSSKIIIHPEFNEITFNNDIAIVKFSEAVAYSPRIQPICMPTRSSTVENVVPGEKGYISGWGLNEEQVASSRLMLAILPVQATQTCESAYMGRNEQIQITQGMYCAGYQEGIINVCRGDSGSPMVFYNNDTDRFTVEGLVSHGTSGSCNQPERYTMFTKVSHYLRWIFQNWRGENG